MMKAIIQWCNYSSYLHVYVWLQNIIVELSVVCTKKKKKSSSSDYPSQWLVSQLWLFLPWVMGMRDCQRERLEVRAGGWSSGWRPWPPTSLLPEKIVKHFRDIFVIFWRNIIERIRVVYASYLFIYLFSFFLFSSSSSSSSFFFFFFLFYSMCGVLETPK
jgi:hypothetical protein